MPESLHLLAFLIFNPSTHDAGLNLWKNYFFPHLLIFKPTRAPMMLGSHWRKTLFSSLSNFQAELCTLVMLVAHSEENMDQPTFLFIVTLIDFRQPSPGHRIVSVPMMMMRGWHQIGINCILILKYQFEREVLPRPPKLKACFHWKPSHCWPFDPLAVSQQEHLCVCVWAKEQAKSFHKIPPALRFRLTAGGLRRCNVCFHH